MYVHIVTNSQTMRIRKNGGCTIPRPLGPNLRCHVAPCDWPIWQNLIGSHHMTLMSLTCHVSTHGAATSSACGST